jgi:uncharacterized protein (DUF58 family)
VSRALQLALLGAAMCLFASAFAVSALYVPGVTLLLVALAAATLVWLATRRARVELHLRAERVEEGEYVSVSASVAGGLSSLCRGALSVVPGAEPVPIDWTNRSAERQVRAARRGRAAVGPATARWADPFQLCVRERASATRELLVLPRLQHVGPRELERIMSLPAPRSVPDDGLEFDGLRELVAGAPASRIHWLTVARTGVAMERRFRDEDGHRPVTVALDAHAAASVEALDMAVRAAASLCHGFATAGGCSVLLPGRPWLDDLAPDREAWPWIHELLATVEQDTAPRWELLREARRLVLVQARPPQAPPGVPACCYVSPLAAAGAGALFRVAGCTVQAARHGRTERAA